MILLLNKLCVANGKIVGRSSTVLGHTLGEDEEKILIYELTDGECTHPEYCYDMEPGGYCSWKRVA